MEAFPEDASSIWEDGRLLLHELVREIPDALAISETAIHQAVAGLLLLIRLLVHHLPAPPSRSCVKSPWICLLSGIIPIFFRVCSSVPGSTVTLILTLFGVSDRIVLSITNLINDRYEQRRIGQFWMSIFSK